MSTKVLYIIIFTIFASTSVAQNRILKKFPKGYTPEEVGIKVANRFLSGKHMLHGGKWIHYAEVCTWYGAVRFASESKNKELSRQLQERFDYLCIGIRNSQIQILYLFCYQIEFQRKTSEHVQIDMIFDRKEISFCCTQIVKTFL